MDLAEAERLEAQLVTTMSSSDRKTTSLATVLSQFIESEKEQLPTAEFSLWKRARIQLEALGRRLERRPHRILISGILLFWFVLVVGFIATLITAEASLEEQVLQWRGVLILIQLIVGVLLLIALRFWLIGREEQGLTFGIGGFLVSLVALQLNYFYISQFSAITATLLQLMFLLILLAYRGGYLLPHNKQ